jgi:hypothetical protein
MTILGLIIVAIGIALALLPYILRRMPSFQLERLPPFLIWIYRSGDFVIATSPILILATLIIIALKILCR